MEVKEILRLAVLFTDQKELLEDAYFLQTVPEEYEPDTDRESKINELLECLNLVYGEITTDYLPLTFKEEVNFLNNRLEFNTLEKTLLNVVGLKNSLGKNIKFNMYPTYIEAKISKAQLSYHFEPEQLSVSSTVSLFGQRVPARVFAFGVAMEHFFLQAQSTEALIWENRYKNALLNIVRKKHNIVLPSRRWI